MSMTPENVLRIGLFIVRSPSPHVAHHSTVCSSQQLSTTNRQVNTHLKLHHSLLKPRPTHRHVPTLLTPTPNLRSIRRLHLSLPLTIFRILLHRRIPQAHSGYRYGIAVRDVLDGFGRRWVVGCDFVAVGAAGGIAAFEKSCWKASLLR